MSKVDVDQLRTGLAAGDIIVLEDVGGTPGLPAVDGSQLTGIATSGSIIKDIVTKKTAGDPEILWRKCGGIMFLRNDCDC